MQQTNTNSTTPVSPSFAGLLAALTAPAPRNAWNTDDLADDVATLSYEHALRAHARYKAPNSGDWAREQESDAAAPAMSVDAPKDGRVAHTEAVSGWLASESSQAAEPKPADDFSAAFERNKKCASITIRLSKTECDQLRRRAAQAGLSVSAYLRSCTFEAETLRAQVKDVLAELRTTASKGRKGVSAAGRRSWLGWVRRHLAVWHGSRRITVPERI
jgi:predicted DNA binding CopG/RHH family protein